ncbi:FixH family protein [uncultured Planktosalinus sp.]|uniref:FixH family protein n=1 Tax=uncultured Planktosalinus sp. TaxID=1810935 RepID=UPI0030D92B4F
MKINWGTGIVIAIALFIAFILYFVITMTTNKNFEHDLVIEDYYKQEIGFQDELDARNNAAKLTEKASIDKTTNGILISFPEAWSKDIQNGKVSFYRVNNKAFDFDKDLKLSNHQMLIPESELVMGRWDVSVYWEMEAKSYTVKEKINF